MLAKLNTGVVDEYFNDDVIRFLKLVTVSDINELNYQIMGKVSNYLLSVNLNQELYNKLFSSSNFINYFPSYNKENSNQFINILNHLDPTGKLKWLYMQITNDNYKV